MRSAFVAQKLQNFVNDIAIVQHSVRFRLLIQLLCIVVANYMHSRPRSETFEQQTTDNIETEFAG